MGSTLLTISATISEDPLLKQIEVTYQQLRQAHANVLAARDRYVAEARQRYEARIQKLETDAPNIRRVLAGWDEDLWVSTIPSMEDAVPAAIRVGRLVHKDDPSLNDMPALFPLIGGQHIFIQSDDLEAGRRLLQTLLLRMVFSSRPGAVRLELTDPVGGGSTISPLLHLPVELRNAKAATRPEEIEALLDVLITHIETVVHTRLLNTYPAVEAYNADQPEIAVPYHLLALPDFPAGLTERAWQRLEFIRKNGPRAGVYILAAYDPAQPPPRKKLDVLEIRQDSISLRLAGGRLIWHDPVFDEMLAIPDDVPGVDLITRWCSTMRIALTQAATHVRFNRVSVPSAHRWQRDAIDGISVPIGVDSSGKVHTFDLGRTNFHALVGGMPGSGKSKFLDVLITQLALTYSPDEVGFYLADLREGVTFQDYNDLPHVRAIALENEREFVLNMLRRMQGEMEPRSAAFKAIRSGIDNLSDYRRITGQAMPRLIMIIDEFQVLFADDDKIASEAGKILEDIARRGRGYGIHLILSSQSPRITGLFHDRIFSQIGLRIAFRCDANVSTAILGEGNDAASDLEQPGEAVYNAALGSRGRNTRLRVALLETGERQDLLTEIRARFGDRYPPPVTFEGKAAASLANNNEWQAALTSSPQPRRRAVKFWLGEPIELKAPTTAVLRREAGRNLLIAGGDETTAYGLLSATVLSLAAQIVPSDLRLIFADFARPETELEGVMEQLVSLLPHKPEVVNSRQAAALLPTLVAIASQRLSGEVPVDSTICLCIAGLHRWRELRSSDGYKLPETSVQLARLLEEGSEAGVHVVAWTDSFASFDRVLKRGPLAAFDLRVGLRMSESDSNAFLGSPAAARMDANRALFCDLAESNDLEKFKPYPLPDDLTLGAVSNWAERTARGEWG